MSHTSQSQEDGSLNVSRSDLVPAISLGVVIIAALFTGINYYLLSEAMTLLFYAVLVRIWTEMGPDDPVLLSRDGHFIEFLLMAVGAVVAGSVFRTWVESVSGEILAIQSLVMAVLLGRWYVNAANAAGLSLASVLQYRDSIDRYLVITPSLIAFFLPIIQRQTTLQIIRFDTTQGFFGLIIVSVFAGVLFYGYEKDQFTAITELIQE